MSWKDLLTALALVLVIEGLLPFAHPSGWKRTLRTIIGYDDGAVRFIGLASMLAGLVLLYIVH